MLSDTQTLTFLFTDIEGSAALWEQHAREMPAALAAHDELLQAIVTTHGGAVVKRTGDSLMAVFQSQPAGVSAALDAQARLQSAKLTPELKVRMGLHCGQAVFRAGDYFGTDVNRAARLMGLAHGGQVLLSEECAAALQPGSADFTLFDLGRYHLKGLMEPQRVFQVSSSGTAPSFPPLAGGLQTPHNLPARLSSFIGREKQLTDLIAIFEGIAKQSETSTGRLVTLIGPGGTGKTRLSIEVGHQLMPAFPDGVWLVELAPLREAVQVPYAIAAVLGLQELPGMPMDELLVAHLSQRKALLILDNCEHMVEAGAELAETLLQHCNSLGLLASSREALGVTGERVYRVPSLGLPAADENDPEHAQSSEAVRLLLERGQAVNRTFSLTPANTPAIVQICRRLDGIPLALELAAVRLSAFSAEQIAARLDDRFRLLTGGSRTALPRQQTLHALIDWSYELLDENEKSLLRQLSVFVGGWTLEAAEALCPELNVLDLLSQLVGKSLVVMDEDATTSRYRLLETIRQFARDHLTDAGEAEAARDRHLTYYSELAESAEQQLFIDHQLDWYQLCETEYENYRAAMDWGLQRAPLTSLELAGNISYFWNRVGHQESDFWLRATLQSAESIQSGDPARIQRARVRAYLMLAMTSVGHIPPAKVMEIGQLALDAAHASGQLESLGYAHGFSAFIATQTGNYDMAEKQYTASIELMERATDLPDGQHVLHNLLPGKIMLHSLRSLILLQRDQNITEARAALDTALAIVGNRQMPYTAGVITLNKIQLERYAGNAASVLPLAQNAYQFMRQIKDQNMSNIFLAEIGHIQRQMGDIESAAETYSQSIRSFAEHRQLGAVAHQLESFAFIALQSNDLARTAQLFGAAESVRARSKSPMTPTESEEYAGRLELLKNSLPPDQFAAAWSGGAALTVGEAVELACALPNA